MVEVVWAFAQISSCLKDGRLPEKEPLRLLGEVEQGLTKKLQKLFVQVLRRYYQLPEVWEESNGFSGHKFIVLKITANDTNY